MPLYIDTISDSLRNAQNTAQGLQEMKRTAIAQRLQLADMLNKQGDEEGAAKALHSAENYGLSSLFAGPVKQWEAQNPFRGKEIGLKEQLSLTPEARQGQTLQDINAVNELKKIYGKDTNSLNAQLELMGITGKPQTLVDTYKQQQSQNNDISAFNKKAEAYNKSLANIPASYKGNEVDQQQQLINDTINAIQNGGGLAAYNRYITTGKAISDHYGHTFQPQPAGFFGIGGKGGGAGNKLERVNIFDSNGKLIGTVKSSDAILTDKDPASVLLKKHNPIFARNGITNTSQFTYKFASSEGSDTLNDLEKENLKKVQAENQMATDYQVNKSADDNAGFFTFRKESKAKEYNSKLDASGDTTTPRMHPVTFKAVPYSEYAKMKSVDQFLGGN